MEIIKVIKNRKGERVASIEKSEAGKYSVWESQSTEMGGKRSTHHGEYETLIEAETEANMILIRREQDEE